MFKKIGTESILTYLIRLIPPLCIAVVFLGLAALSTLLKKPEMLLRGQYLALPIIAASLIIIFSKPKNIDSKEIIKLHHLPIGRRNYHLIYILLYLISIYLLIAYQTRPLAYFILIGLMAVVIFAEILTANYVNKPAGILLKIILLAANLIFGQTLKLPLYFGGTDILPHLNWIKTLLTNQHITTPMENYEYFPLYHILNAMGRLLTNLDLQNAYFAVIGLSFLSSIYFIYLIAYRVTESINKSLAATLIYSLSSEALFAGMSMVTRVMSYVVFLIMFYLLLTKKQGDARNNMLALFLIIPLVLLHQITLVQEVMIFIAFFMLEIIIYHRNKLFRLMFPLIFIVGFTSYWLYVASPFFNGTIKILFTTTETVVIPESPPNAPLYMSFTGNLETTIFAFFAIIGVYLLLVHGLAQKEKGRLGVLFALFSFLAMPLFFRGPADYFSPLLLSYRIPLMILPFMIVPVAEGLFFFLKSRGTRPQNTMKSTALLSFTIFVLAMTTTLTLGNSTDLNLKKLLVKESRQYFTESELSGFDFCTGKINNDIEVYTDYESVRYLSKYAGRKASSSNEFIESPATVGDGYLFLRSDHLKERGKLVFVTGGAGFMGMSKTYTADDFNKKLILENLEKQNKTFENNTGVVYLSSEAI